MWNIIVQYYFGVNCIGYLFMCSIILESVVLGIYLCLKIFFLIDTNAKMWSEIIDLVVLGRNYISSCRV